MLAAAVAAGAVHALAPTDPDAGHEAYQALRLAGAWDVTTGSPGVLVAIVDSGVDPSHPDLAGAVRSGYDFVDGDADASELPSGASGRFAAPEIFSSATSIAESAPTTSARNARPSASVTVILDADSITWLFVRMNPSPSMMKPLPEPCDGASRSRGPPSPLSS